MDYWCPTAEHQNLSQVLAGLQPLRWHLLVGVVHETPPNAPLVVETLEIDQEDVLEGVMVEDPL